MIVNSARGYGAPDTGWSMEPELRFSKWIVCIETIDFFDEAHR
jgi:hypothetical protein